MQPNKQKYYPNQNIMQSYLLLSTMLLILCNTVQSLPERKTAIYKETYYSSKTYPAGMDDICILNEIFLIIVVMNLLKMVLKSVKIKLV